MTSRRLFAALWAGVVVFVGAALYRPASENLAPAVVSQQPASSPTASSRPAAREPGGHTSASTTPRPAGPTRDMSQLIRPEHDYLGVAQAGIPSDRRKLAKFVRETKSRPNVITIYQDFGDDFAAAEAKKIFKYGALPLIRWEPFDARPIDIARGKHDSEISHYAAAVKQLNVPVAITFAHEMNGFWYPWGAAHVRASDYTAAWRRVHRIFQDVGATNVIWSWAPNVISGGPGVRLVDWYPGDKYVDWIGIDGYFAAGGPDNYDALFGATFREIDSFTNRPYLIVETGVERGWSGSHRALKSLFKGVADDDRVVGFVYFNQIGSRQWQLSGDSAALAIYSKSARRLQYGFTVR